MIAKIRRTKNKARTFDVFAALAKTLKYCDLSSWRTEPAVPTAVRKCAVFLVMNNFDPDAQHVPNACHDLRHPMQASVPAGLR